MRLFDLSHTKLLPLLSLLIAPLVTFKREDKLCVSLDDCAGEGHLCRKCSLVFANKLWTNVSSEGFSFFGLVGRGVERDHRNPLLYLFVRRILKLIVPQDWVWALIPKTKPLPLENTVGIWFPKGNWGSVFSRETKPPPIPTFIVSSSQFPLYICILLRWKIFQDSI